MAEFKGIRNENGRPKGAVNKNTAQIRENFQSLIENNLEQLENDLKELKPFERIKIVLELSKFVLPTLKATELTTSTDNGFNPVQIIFKKIEHDANSN